MNKRYPATVGAGALLAGVALTLFAGSSAVAAEPEINGQVAVTLDFSTEGSVDVAVWTKNLSTVSAYGTGYVRSADGDIEDWGPRAFAPGEVWTYTTTLAGYGCDDLPETRAVAFGWATQNQSVPDWTSGVISYPDSRVTVIGCDTPSPTPTPTATPTVTPSPTAAALPTAAAAATPTREGGLAATGADNAWIAPAAVAGAAVVALGASSLVIARRRRAD